jgi:signal transduction histidine kinase
MKATVQNIYLFSILLLCSFAVYSQNTEWTDSVKKVLETQKADTNKIFTLISLSNSYQLYYPDSGLTYAQQALDLAEKLHYEYGIFWSEVALSNVFSILGNYPLELDYGFKTLSLAKKMNTPLEIGQAFGILSDCYYNLGEYNTSLQYRHEVIKIVEQSFPGDIYNMWIWLSRIFESMHQPDSAMLYAKKAYEEMKRNQVLSNESYEGRVKISFISPILGNAFAGKGNYDSALLYYRMGIPVSTNSYLETKLINDYNGIAAVYKATGNMDSAIWYSKKVLTEKITKTYPVGFLKAVNLLADIYESQNKPDSTLKYLRIAIVLKDSLFNREKTIAIQNITYKEQERQKEIEAAKLELRNKFRIYFLVAGLITVLVLSGILLRNKRQKQLQNIRNSIADDLHDDIGSTLTNISILSELSKQHLDPKDNANKFLTRISEEVNTTSQALDDIIWSVNVRNDSVDEIMVRMRRYAGELFDAGRLKYDLRFDDSLSGIKLSMDQRRDLYLIFKEAVNNIYKHANASQVTIELNKEEHQIVMRIKDDGRGFETKPSHRNGFKNMQSRAQKRKGHLQIESVLCKGTSVILFFPLK